MQRVEIHTYDDTVVCADDGNDISAVNYMDEADKERRVWVEGQSGDVCGLATHPIFPQIYATACADGTVCVWDAQTR
jgi:WD40 repeat protein